MSSTGHGIPVDPLPMIMILQQGIRQALLDEAVEWTGDARIEVWMATISAARRMGIVITKDELYALQRERQKQLEQQTPPADATAPACPQCGDNRQVWRNQISGLWKCHRAYCDTVIEDQKP